MVGTRFYPSTGWHYRFSRTVLASFTGGPRTCSSLIGEPGSSSLCTVSTILRQTWTDCMLLAMKEVEACSRSRQCTSLALWGWNVISVIVPIRICSLYMSVTLEDPGTRSRAWLVALLHSCGGIWLRTTRRRTCTEVVPWHLTVSSSKRLRWMRNISAQFSLCAVMEPETYARSVSPSH